MTWPQAAPQVPQSPPATRLRRVLTDDLTGYKVTAAKSMDEYAKLDAEDESLARWKASLGVVPAAAGPASGPKVSGICAPDSYGGLLVTATR